MLFSYRTNGKNYETKNVRLIKANVVIIDAL